MRPALPTSILTLALTSCLLSPALAQAPPPRAAEPAAPAPPAVRPPIAGRMLTLDECIAIALEAQPKITATLFDYAAARYRLNQACAPLLPQLTGSVGATRSDTIFVCTWQTTGQTSQTLSSRQLSDTFLAQVQLSQLLFDFGKNLAFTESQRKLAEVAVEAIELQRQLIALAVKEAYTNSLLGQRLIKANQQALDRADLNLRSAKSFFEVGTRPKSDVARAEVDVANAKLSLIQARNAVRTAIVALNIAMAVDVDTPTQIVDNLIFEATTIDRQAHRAEALRSRPEDRHAPLHAAAAQASERQMFRNFFPDITGA